MELNEKLQELRIRKGITQEELAQALFVSRAAVSKWESGRGCPSVDSLKAIAAYFSVSIDELLSGNELASTAEDSSKTESPHLNTVFALLDLSILLLFFLPFFAQNIGGAIETSSLAALHTLPLYLKFSYCIFVGASVVSCAINFLYRKSVSKKLSIALSVSGLFLFIISRQPYAAIFLLSLLIIKTFALLKSR